MGHRKKRKRNRRPRARGRGEAEFAPREKTPTRLDEGVSLAQIIRRLRESDDPADVQRLALIDAMSTGDWSQYRAAYGEGIPLTSSNALQSDTLQAFISSSYVKHSTIHKFLHKTEPSISTEVYAKAIDHALSHEIDPSAALVRRMLAHLDKHHDV